ncbi:DUF1858 domain-containing protein [Anaeromyxobacter diazotrophicus]|uniref:DUF1858 domain-containing protein n=1 Tax=Anaeromyxobacter diazotrophicus TaxID=2590199 RepID=A0A7I9VHH7_9BACT|nr:DUF1858 domain-containing protein [Anaeromyxobacter diazotrophicus]GEJ55846.1 hypothetical protein AMYX_05870 [Anaeromyxobacter diazotrophicus]
MAEGCAAADITPDSKLGALLERWPGLEVALLEISPHFQALRNPVLRRTVAKVATLRQVASVSGVPLATLIDRLRAAAGLPPLAVAAAGDAPAASPPAWLAGATPARTHDARAAIQAGEHPMQRVMADLAALAPGEAYELVTPFVPAPLLDLARAKGFESYSAAEGEGLVRTWFRRAGAPG